MADGTERSGQGVATIVETLRQEIISGKLNPDEPLGQEQLATRFGVSRMPVREAIRQLETLGFVTVEPNKSARVAPVSLADFLEIYDMRIAAECLAMKSAIPELTNTRIDEAEAIQDQIEDAPVGAFGDLNIQFHMTLYRASGRHRLLAHVQALGNAADRYHCMTVAGPEIRRKSDLEHRALLEHCRQRDSDAAVAMVAQHISEARDHLSGLIGELERR